MPLHTKDSQKATIGLVITALGVVFGDIGTSPLYSFSIALSSATLINNESVLGLASLIVWYLLLIVTVKYVWLVMRANYEGEGGIFALLALLRKANLKSARTGVVGVILLVGAALLYGDATITPAISVLSAVEGIRTVHPSLEPFAMPATVIILIALFATQRFGSGKIGWIFGPVMLVWFAVIGLCGLIAIIRTPQALEALNPIYGLRYLQNNQIGALTVFGAIVLAITGAEALYADLGHFGRTAISRAWHFFALPALALNYLGQAATVLAKPSLATSSTLFFEVLQFPELRAGLVVLAAIATVVASQAVITGVFSLTSQAMDLGLLPWFCIHHTSHLKRGQIYIPAVNFVLGVACILLVLIFRKSVALGDAYGLAVTGTMLTTSIGFGLYLFYVAKQPWWLSLLALLMLMCLELPLFLGCLPKIETGGYVPIIIASCVFILIASWRYGRNQIRLQLRQRSISLKEFAEYLALPERQRVQGTLVFPIHEQLPEVIPPIALEYERRTRVLPQQLVILKLSTRWDRARNRCSRLELEDLGNGLWIIKATTGYQIEPDAFHILKLASKLNPQFRWTIADSFLVINRLVLLQRQLRKHRWKSKLYALMSRNTQPWSNYLSVPTKHLVEFTYLLEPK